MASMDGAPGFDRLVNGAANTVANVRRSEVDTPLIASTPKRVEFTQWSTEWNPVSRQAVLSSPALTRLICIFDSSFLLVK